MDIAAKKYITAKIEETISPPQLLKQNGRNDQATTCNGEPDIAILIPQ